MSCPNREEMNLVDWVEMLRREGYYLASFRPAGLVEGEAPVCEVKMVQWEEKSDE